MASHTPTTTFGTIRLSPRIISSVLSLLTLRGGLLLPLLIGMGLIDLRLRAFARRASTSDRARSASKEDNRLPSLYSHVRGD